MAPEGLRPRGRPAHTPGTTVFAYTPNGRNIITGGSNSSVRIYTVGEDGEPKTVDEGMEGHLAIAALNDSYILGAEDGTVWQYGLPDGKMDKMLVRCSLPVRALAISKDKEWIAVASDELAVKIVNIEDMTQVKYLRDQTKGVKHITFDPSGRYVTASSSDGIIYVYSFLETEPQLVHKIDGVIQRLENEDEATSQAAWHPDGTAFAAVEPTRDIVVVSSKDWTKQKKFRSGHTAKITAIAWSPNGAMLLSAGADDKILVWETRTQNILKRYDFANVMNIAWHPENNHVSFTTSDGEIFIYESFLPPEYEGLLEKSLDVAPLLTTGIDLGGELPSRPLPAEAHKQRRVRRGSPDSLDDILGPMDEDEDFVEDDDGAGYAEGINDFGKRTGGHLGDESGPNNKRRTGVTWSLQTHEPFQPGSTPWRGGRRYLCLNLVGFAWTVDQETHHTVTVEFFDREQYRDFHFTDPFLYDKACLNERGTLFACQPANGNPANLFYRPHEMWTTRADWRTELPQGETITAIALSTSYVVVSTSKDYVRVYTLFGVPYRIYRQKSHTVTCAAWKNYVLTIGNGPVAGDGVAKLTYSIENVKRDHTYQNEDTVALARGAELRSVFFSDLGDPCIYDTSGVLLVLQHWRKAGQARWVPLLDTTQLERIVNGRKQETYWPVAVAGRTFHCIILKGGDKEPYFPRPLLSQFDFKMPVSSTPKPSVDENDDYEMAEQTYRDLSLRLEEKYARAKLEDSLLEDCIEAGEATSAQAAEHERNGVEIDKLLLQMIGNECRDGEQRGMKVLEMVGLLRDRTGKMLEGASRIAQRYQLPILDDRIRQIAEKRMQGRDGGDDDDDDDIFEEYKASKNTRMFVYKR